MLNYQFNTVYYYLNIKTRHCSSGIGSLIFVVEGLGLGLNEPTGLPMAGAYVAYRRNQARA